ncbi:hypothetical protein ACFVS2_24995 [Brevibacillus sp. NPDC058079]|uniref:hypothetical protein n=1 Tax=Brevibacillus sp. NPDC058079 TaxID=3346330 RepID=UPI0036E042D4
MTRIPPFISAGALTSIRFLEKFHVKKRKRGRDTALPLALYQTIQGWREITSSTGYKRETVTYLWF